MTDHPEYTLSRHPVQPTETTSALKDGQLQYLPGGFVYADKSYTLPHHRRPCSTPDCHH